MAKEKQTDAFKTMGALFEPLINALSKDAEVRESIINLIGREGPPHKQWQHTLVLSRLQVLLQQTAKATGKKFKPVKGTPITITDPKHEEGETFPLSFPPQSFSFIGQEANLQEKLSKVRSMKQCMQPFCYRLLNGLFRYRMRMYKSFLASN